MLKEGDAELRFKRRENNLKNVKCDLKKGRKKTGVGEEKKPEKLKETKGNF